MKLKINVDVGKDIGDNEPYQTETLKGHKMKNSLTNIVSVEIICEAIANFEQCAGLGYEELIRFVSTDIGVIDYLWDHWQIDLFELF